MNFDAGIFLILAGVFACVFLLLLVLSSRKRVISGKTPDGAKLSLAVNKTDYAVLLVTPDGALEWANAAFTRITGYELAEVSGKPIGPVLLGSLHSPKAAQQIKNGLTRTGFHLEMLCAHKDGHRYWLSLNLSPVLDGQERVVNFIGFGADITARRRAEDESARVNRRNEMF